MSEKEREIAIFHLCKSLVDLLGEEQAIADLQILYERHPEMFKDKDEVKEVIEKVVSEPDLIMKNPYFSKEQEILVAKKLDIEKMGDVVIKSKEGANEIFHANKKRIRDFDRLQRLKEKMEANGGDALSLHTAGQAYTGANVVSSTLSSASDSIIPQNSASLENTNNLTNVSESAIIKMKQKIDEIAQKGFKSNAKDNTKDKGVER